MAPVRRAGLGLTPAGEVSWWSVAEGRRGRRWRESVAGPGGLRHALLLETDPAGRFLHLELATPAGLLTLHPEPDGTLHGNHVRPRGAGIRHVVGWPFAPDDTIVVEGSPISLAAIAWPRAASVAEGSFVDVAGVVIGAGGELDAVPSIRIEHLTGSRWQVGEWPPLEVDVAGLPVLDGGATGPLERG